MERGFTTGMLKVTYLTSITAEKDPERRKAKLAKYAEQAKQELSRSPVPPDWPK